MEYELLRQAPFHLSDQQLDWVKETLGSLSREQKVGQLFCLMGGDYPIEALTELVREKGVGAVLYRPAPGEEIRRAFAALDKAARVPLLKAANLEEGGWGGTTDGTLFGWPMTVSAAHDEKVTERFAALTAAEGRSIGVNWTFSPVCDLDMNFRNPITNVRTFGSDPDMVIRNATCFTRTVQRYGIAACAKHFPGDGVDFRDQHLHPTYNSLSAEAWYKSYGAVYRALIDQGLLSVMAGHIVQPALSMAKAPSLTFEGCLPGSQSRELLTGVLREELGFNGVITTDATIMAGYSMPQERRRAIPATIMAGADMLVFSTDFEEDRRYLLEVLEDGRLTMGRLDEAVARILALKAVVALGKEKPEYHSDILASASAWQEQCAHRAVTLVKDLGGILPVTPEKYPRIRLVILGNDDLADRRGRISDLAARQLTEAGFTVERYDPEADRLHGTAGLDRSRLTLYIANHQTYSNRTTVRIDWSRNHALDVPRHVKEEPVVFLSLSNPYHLQDVPRVPVYINAYSATAPLLAAALEKLRGRSPFMGVSPVDAFCGLPDTRL